MKISNSKKQLAKIIHENGGWRDGAQFSAQDKDGEVFHYSAKPTIGAGREVWSHKGCIGDGEFTAEKLPNWHQTILSREEYFHLYPAPDADGWIEYDGKGSPYSNDVVVEAKWTDGDFTCGDNFGPGPAWIVDENGPNITHHRLHNPGKSKPEFCKSVIRSIPEPSDNPTIEQLAADYHNRKAYADRKQQEADAAKADAEAKLAELVAAGKAHGLVLSVAVGVEGPEPEPVITDWRDLLAGDEISVQHLKNVYSKSAVMAVGDSEVEIRNHAGARKSVNMDEVNWKFIRRPAKGDANA